MTSKSPDADLQQREGTRQDGELSIGELFAEVSKLASWFARHGVALGLAALVGCAAGVYQFLDADRKFEATLIFMVNEEQIGAGGMFSNVLNSFGFGGGSGSAVNPNRILDIATSSLIVHPTLFDTTVVGDTVDTYANALLRFEPYEQVVTEHWAEKGWAGQPAFTRDDVSEMDGQELWLLRYVVNELTDERRGILTTGLEEDSGLMTLNATFPNESMAIALVNALYDNLSTYYVQRTIYPQQQNFNRLSGKVDSLRNRLAYLTAEAARVDDSRRSVIRRVDRLKSAELDRELQVAALAYGKALENQEVADFALRSQTPNFQIVSRPLPPLAQTGSGIVVNILAFVFGALLLTSFGIVVWNFLRS